MSLEKQNDSKSFNRLGQLLETSTYVKILEVIFVFLVAFLFIKTFISNKDSNLLYNQAIIWFANIIMLSIVFLGLKLRNQNLSHFGFSFKKFNWKFGLKTVFQSIIVFILTLAGFIIGSIIMIKITGVPENSDMSNYAYLKDNIWMLFLTLGGIYIVSSFGEEVIYRAFLINRISELRLGNKVLKIFAIFFSAIVFGFAHYSWGIMGIVQTTFMGLALGFSYIYLKKRIWVLILAHAYMDTILMLQLYFG